ncbi:hypothetical protein [Streptomyces huiliensis]|uniref:hypothetical protein n=1 Tax=Streptomyces huiliensis TaxID=2876027 RepID=UPI001CBBE3AB|nr:hypothetical protein [Streptomyces huiliensis]MBZ4320153.1 hypothetical protein [Streptomyces huiliensis]
MPRRLRAAWKAVHDPVAGVPRWARVAAYAVPLVVLPSSLWRVGGAFLGGGAEHGRGDLPAWLPSEAYVLFLSLLSEALAITAVGLVAAWGEVFPRWVPVLRGRRVPTAAAVVPGAVGAVLLTLLWTVLLIVTELTGTTVRGDPLPDDYPGRQGGWAAAVYYACYAPLVLWGPLLGLVTVAYWRRRAAGVVEAVGTAGVEGRC